MVRRDDPRQFLLLDGEGRRYPFAHGGGSGDGRKSRAGRLATASAAAGASSLAPDHFTLEEVNNMGGLHVRRMNVAEVR